MNIHEQVNCFLCNLIYAAIIRILNINGVKGIESFSVHHYVSVGKFTPEGNYFKMKATLILLH